MESAARIDLLARLGYGGVDRQAAGQRPEQRRGELDRGAVAELELHRDHGRDLAAHQRLGDSSEPTDRIAATRLAGVEDR